MIKSLTKNAVLNTIKQVFQIIFPFITIPYVTRILTPENYGMVTFSSSCVSYFSLIAALGISTYGVREGAVIRDNRKSLSKLASELLTLNLISTIICICISASVSKASGLQQFNLFTEYHNILYHNWDGLDQHR